jgi:DNA primase
MNALIKEKIIQSISIVSIAKNAGVVLHNAGSGNFQYKCICPNPNHKNGNERSSSCYINTDKNTFFCFGCNCGSNVIDFYMLIYNKTFTEAGNELYDSLATQDLSDVNVNVNRENITSILLDISKVFRCALQQHPYDADWILQKMKKTDDYISKIDMYDSESATKLHVALSELFNKRYE